MRTDIIALHLLDILILKTLSFILVKKLDNRLRNKNAYKERRLPL